MISMWTDCIIAGLKTFDSVKASRKNEVKAELERRVTSGELSQDVYNRIFGIEPAE